AKDDKCISYEETKRLMDTLGGKCKVTEYGGHFMEVDGFTTFTRLQSKMQGIMSQ
ncbi:serine hydrolase family protein, partial [Bacillus subtilis]|nr:serine hydrolase family protein [Bacillus subtilis]